MRGERSIVKLRAKKGGKKHPEQPRSAAAGEAQRGPWSCALAENKSQQCGERFLINFKFP